MLVTEPQSRSEHAIGYRPDIDGLRAVAVLAVVAFHTFPGNLPSGYFGVDIFFVISGYLISRIIFADLQRGGFTIRSFYDRRVRRIFPALLIVLATCFVVGFRCLLMDELKELGKHIAAGSVFLSNVVLWQEAGYFDKAAELKPLLHLWSLGVEEQFYIAWPITLGLLWKRPRLIAPVIAVLGALSLGLSIGNLLSSSAKFYLPFARIWELSAGGALAYRHHVRGHQGLKTASPSQNAMALAGAVTIMAALVVLDRSTPFLEWWGVAPTLGAVLIMAAPQRAWVNRVVLGNPVFVTIGLISYPLYLWHWPIITFLRIQGIEPLTPGREAMKIGLMFLLAWLTYQFVEKPLRARSRVRAILPVLCVAMALMGCVGIYAVMQDGIPNRFAPEAQRLADFKYPRYQYLEDGRHPACWVRTTDRADSFAPECVEKSTYDGQPLVVLWGDSHAAVLYPGVKAMQERFKFRVAQFTRSKCPPLSDGECARSNAWVMRQIAVLQPDVVLLAANWNVHWDDGGASTLAALERTILALKRAGTRRVVVMGPVPKWNDGLPRALFNFYRQDLLLHRIPSRMRFGLTQGVSEVDAALSQLVQRHDATYISARDLLCTQDGCLTYVDDNPSHLTNWDAGHVTRWGAKYLVGRFPAAIWQSEPTPEPAR